MVGRWRRTGPANIRKSTIYIVDDDPDVVEALTHLVKPTKARVETFSRANEFLARFRPTGPACLVLDVQMPDMQGTELLKRLKRDGHTIPIIIVTGHGDAKMAADARKAGAFSFQHKPFRAHKLLEEIERALRADEEAWKRREERKGPDR